MKKLLSLLLVISLVLGIAPVAFASNLDENDNTNDVYAYIVWNGQTYPLTEEETELFKTNPEEFSFYNETIEKPPVMTPFAVYGYYTNKKEYAPALDYSKSQYVSSCFSGLANGVEMSITQSASISSTWTAGASLSANYKSIIEASLNASVSKTASSDSSQGATYFVNPGKYGRYQFTPAMVRTTGTFVVEEDRVGGVIVETSRTAVDVKFPKTLNNGLADGLYEPVIKSYYF